MALFETASANTKYLNDNKYLHAGVKRKQELSVERPSKRHRSNSYVMHVYLASFFFFFSCYFVLFVCFLMNE